MTKLVILKLDGDSIQGYSVTLEIGSNFQELYPVQKGNLPPMDELWSAYGHWQLTYRSLGGFSRGIKPKKIRYDGSINKRREECHQSAKILSLKLNEWLNGDSLRQIREQWLARISPVESVRILISTNQQEIRQLPWHQWDFLELYQQAEIAFINSEYQPCYPNQKTGKVKILAILGNQEGINIEQDKKLLQSLPNAAITFLIEPERQQLSEQLWAKPWDIIFFAGHSRTEDEQGRIYLNSSDSLTLDELRFGLSKAIRQGLQIAIFNSCEGLGLAYQLEKLNIPHLIVMREPVPDQVAHTFLTYFLSAFVRQNNFYLAVREAREKLQGIENQFPCASWLPIICQNPTVIPPTWQDLRGNHYLPKRIPLLISIGVSFLIIGMRMLGLFQLWELQLFDQLMRLRLPEAPDSRLVIIEVTEEEINRYGFPIPDAILGKAIKQLNSYHPRVIGLDIFRPHSDKLLQPYQNIIALCSAKESNQNNKFGIAPPKISLSLVGFSDVVVDVDSILRRHLMFMQPSLNDPCATNYAFSVRVALDYLASEGIKPQTIDRHQIKIGETVFKDISENIGGYHQIDARGFQIFLNYRATEKLAQQITLSQVLAAQIAPESIKDKIILIGVTAPISSDYFLTPYSRGNLPYQPIPGVIIQGHMVSQIVSSILDKRPLISTWNEWQEILWIGGWGIIGGVSAWYSRRLLYWDLAATGIVIILLGICWVSLMGGVWLPLLPSMLGLIIAGGGVIFWIFVHR